MPILTVPFFAPSLMYVKRILSLSLCFLVITLMSWGASTERLRAENYVIIINADTTGSPDDSELKNMYLKKQTTWSSGITAIPFGRAPHSPEQQAFLAKILEMNQAELDSYWASEKSKTGATGPRAVNSVSILLRQIRKKEGAFGIISSTDATDIPEGVKILKSF